MAVCVMIATLVCGRDDTVAAGKKLIAGGS
jgi:hypothetical protein